MDNNRNAGSEINAGTIKKANASISMTHRNQIHLECHLPGQMDKILNQTNRNRTNATSSAMETAILLLISVNLLTTLLESISTKKRNIRYQWNALS